MKGLSKKVGLYPALLLATWVLIPTAFCQTLPSFSNVVIVLGENQNYSTSYNSSNMPYLTSLANEYGIGVNYYSDTHPSIGNYLNLATGNILTDDDSRTPQNFPVSLNNIALEVQNAGGTWKDYIENNPSNATCKGLTQGSYYVRHDPLQYLTTVNTERTHYVCFSQFQNDLLRHQLPTLSWLVPNGCDDAHDCSIQTFDNWLRNEIGLLLTTSYFRPGGSGIADHRIRRERRQRTSGLPDHNRRTGLRRAGGAGRGQPLQPEGIPVARRRHAELQQQLR